MAISGASLRLWGLLVIAHAYLHLVGADNGGVEDITLDVLDENAPLFQTGRSLAITQAASLQRLRSEVPRLFPHREASVQNTQAMPGSKAVRLLNQELGEPKANATSAVNATSAPSEEAGQKRVLDKLAKKRERESAKAVAKANADEAKVKASATKKIMKDEAAAEKKDAAQEKAEGDAAAAGKPGAEAEDAELKKLRAQARQQGLQRLYAKQVEIAERAKEYSHKVEYGSKDADKAGASIEKMRQEAEAERPHEMTQEVQERVGKAAARMAARGKVVANAVQQVRAGAAPEAAAALPGASKGSEPVPLVPDANGEEAPAVKEALKAAVKQAQSSPNKKNLAAVSQLTNELEKASDHDKKAEEVASDEIGTKMKNVKKDSVIRMKREALERAQAKEAKKEKTLEEKRELQALEAEESAPKLETKLEKKLEAAKTKVLKKKLKEKLMETESEAAAENAKMKEKEAARAVQAKEVNLKASEKANELEEKRRGEVREAQQKKALVDRENAKEQSMDDQERLERLRSQAKEIHEKTQKKKEEASTKVAKAKKNEQKSQDKDMMKAMGLSGAALKDKLKARRIEVEEESKKEVAKAEQEEEEQSSNLEKEMERLRIRIAKDKRKAVVESVKLDSLKARDAASLDAERRAQLRREDEKYREKVESKTYREKLKAKLVRELKEEVRAEVYGPYKQKLEARLKADLTAEMEDKMKQEAKASGAMKDLTKESEKVVANLRKMGSAVDNHSKTKKDQPSAGELGDSSSDGRKSAIEAVKKLAFKAAENAANIAAHAAEVQVEQSQMKDKDAKKRETFSWAKQNDFWEKKDALKVEELAAARGARAAVKNRAAKAAVQHLIQTLDKADGVYEARQKQEMSP